MQKCDRLCRLMYSVYRYLNKLIFYVLIQGVFLDSLCTAAFVRIMVTRKTMN